jgi:hypothetical protein
MSEKIKCPACYRKYDPTKKRACPQCGLSPQNAATLSTVSTDLESVGIATTLEFEPYTGLDAQDMRDDINRLGSAVGQLAAGVIALILTSILGATLITSGSGIVISCALKGQTCGGQDLILWGQISIGVGILIGLITSISAISKSAVD